MSLTSWRFPALALHGSFLDFHWCFSRKGCGRHCATLSSWTGSFAQPRTQGTLFAVREPVGGPILSVSQKVTQTQFIVRVSVITGLLNGLRRCHHSRTSLCISTTGSRREKTQLARDGRKPVLPASHWSSFRGLPGKVIFVIFLALGIGPAGVDRGINVFIP